MSGSYDGALIQGVSEWIVTNMFTQVKNTIADIKSRIHGNIMVAPPFYNILYGINYRLLNITYIVAVGIHVVKRVSNHFAWFIITDI